MAAAIMKIALPVEPPLWEMNSYSWLLTSNNNSNYWAGILAFEGSFSWRLMFGDSRCKAGPKTGQTFTILWAEDSIKVFMNTQSKPQKDTVRNEIRRSS